MSKRSQAATAAISSAHKSFCDSFKTLSERYSRHAVWSDFVTMAAISISNSFDMRYYDERENQYLKIMNNYTKQDADHFVNMFSQTMTAIQENPEQDFLGDVFGKLELHNEWVGQFFTPYHVGEMMALMQMSGLPEGSSDSTQLISVSDPACGAGCLLIAAANIIKRSGSDIRRFIFYAQDLDYVAALMCYIQLSLHGCIAVIKIGDSLAHPMSEDDDFDECYWFTPEYGVYTNSKISHPGTKESA